MTILQRNQKISLSAINPSISKIIVGLGWKVGTNEEFDLDTSAFMLTHDNQIRDRGDFVFYGNLKDSLGVLKHSGDNVSGGEGDSERISVDLSKVPDIIGHITFVVTIHDAINRQQTFGKVQDAYIRIFDINANQEILRFNLGQEFYTATSVVIGDILKRNGEWFFDAVGVPFSGGLQALGQDFDIKATK